ncbi:MAG: GNAT family N-acetyltransferase [Betaproteobacteria bacterium]|jgi:GNAT superfamily N-acetyltransferase|nr:GNAT family N-acetyltransferase [Betaproteobacteria bacterium]
MQRAEIVQAIGADGAEIGARAAGHLDLAFRQMMVGRGAEAGRGFLRLVTGERHPLGNVAIVSDAGDLQVMCAAVLPLLECGQPAAVLYTRGVSQAVAEAVAALGFAGPADMPAMAVDIARLASTELPPGCDLVRVGDLAGSRAWTAVLAEGYPLPPGLAHRFSPEFLGAGVAADAPLQFFAVMRDGRAVATSMLCLEDGLAGIYCVATLPGERGKGLGAHVTAAALLAARRIGYRVGILQSSPEGHSIYRRLGFADVGAVAMFVRMPD